MFSHPELTVANVSGIIAALIFIAQIILSLTLPIVVLGFLNSKSVPEASLSAQSWSALARFFQSSYWPTILRSDSTPSRSTPKSVSFWIWLSPVLSLLIGLSSIVTPLGLYEQNELQGSTSMVEFQYLPDSSAFGYGTPPRKEGMTFSRMCGSLQKACVNSYGISDIRVPPYVVDEFQSGLSDFDSSVSSFFDIDPRSFSSMPGESANASTDDTDSGHGASQVSTYANKMSFGDVILDRKIFPVEGLIVDAVDGGVGLRNHSAPNAANSLGASWSEDILFVSPETVCVDLNITVDFTLDNFEGGYMTAKKIVLTDRGGFKNFSQDLAIPNYGSRQDNPHLYERALRAARLNNFLTMAFLNVTDMGGLDGDELTGFNYINSHEGKTFDLPSFDGSGLGWRINLSPYSLSIVSFGEYLPFPISNSSTGNFSARSTSDYSNPFEIDQEIFNLIQDGCENSKSPKATDPFALCGLLMGTPLPANGGNSFAIDGNTDWTIPLYSCISASKASIKTVNFAVNGSHDLSNLKIQSYTDKTYTDDAPKPLWGIEDTHGRDLDDQTPIWGLVSSAKSSNFSVLQYRKEDVYLSGNMFAESSFTNQNMPGLDAFNNALITASQISPGSTIMDEDYSGQSNLAMSFLWRNLSRSADTASKIIDLVWTNEAASMVVGTKGRHTAANPLTKRDSGSSNEYPVQLYERQVKYHIVYAIPAMITGLLLLLALGVAAVQLLTRRAGWSKMELFLRKTSVGRVLTSRNHEIQTGEISLANKRPADNWKKLDGQKFFILGEAADGTLIVRKVEKDENFGTDSSYVGYTTYPDQKSAQAAFPTQYQELQGYAQQGNDHSQASPFLNGPRDT